MLNEVELKEKREVIIKQRDEFVNQANGQIAFFNGQIAMIDDMLNHTISEVTPIQKPESQEKH